MSLLLSISKSLALEWGNLKEKHRVGKLVVTMGRGALGRRFRGKGIMSVTAILLWD